VYHSAADYQILLERRDFKVVIMSATADIETVNRYFSPHPMAVIHLPAIPHSRTIKYEECAVADVTQRTVELMTTIITNPPSGILLRNVLVFMPGQEEVLHTVDAIRKVVKALEPSANVFPLYASMVNRDADQALKVRDSRSIFVATNIGETSITFPGLGFVIDSGLIKQCKYHSVNHFSTLWVTHESQAAGAQRAGRAGREGPGMVYRLFTADEWEKFPLYDEVPLLLEDYSTVALELLALGYPSLDMVNLPSKSS
jgi:HrpA-like RNA helicase